MPGSPPESLLADPHLTVTFERSRGLVRYVRSHEPYSSIEVARVLHERLGDGGLELPRGDLKLLIDLRDAPPRNDDGFEGQMMKSLAAFLPQFSKYAILVKSAVGRLQVQRLARGRGESDSHAFDDESEALRHLGV